MTTTLDPASCALLDVWAERRKALGLTRRQPIFATFSQTPNGSHGQPLQQRYVRAALSRAGEEAGLEKRVHPHGLRHSLAFQMYTDGVPLLLIQRQLRHSNLAATEHYIRHLCPDNDLAEIMAARPDWTQTP